MTSHNTHPATPDRLPVSRTDEAGRTIIRCRTTADFLAALPYLTGYTASRSMFIVLFSGKRAGSAVRIDLPPDEAPETTTPFINAVIGLLHQLGADSEATSPAIAIMSELTFADADGMPWRRLARRLDRRLRSAGIVPRDLCCQAPDGWVSYLDPAAPVGGRPLSEIEQSPAGLASRLDSDIVPRDIAFLGAVPAPDPERAAAVRSALNRFRADGFPGELHPIVEHDIALLGTTALPDGFHRTAEVAADLLSADASLDVDTTARLIRVANHPDCWLVLVGCVLANPDTMLEIVTGLDATEFTELAVNRAGPAWGTGRTPRDTGAKSVARLGQTSVQGLLMAFGAGRDEPGRYRRLSEQLLAVISETPERLRPNLFALSAWLWWLSGSQTVALRHTAAALEIDPRHEIAAMVDRLIEIPHAPGFLTAVQPPHAAHRRSWSDPGQRQARAS